jgi:hypothetical protein
MQFLYLLKFWFKVLQNCKQLHFGKSSLLSYTTMTQTGYKGWDQMSSHWYKWLVFSVMQWQPPPEWHGLIQIRIRSVPRILSLRREYNSPTTMLAHRLSFIWCHQISGHRFITPHLLQLAFLWFSIFFGLDKYWDSTFLLGTTTSFHVSFNSFIITLPSNSTQPLWGKNIIKKYKNLPDTNMIFTDKLACSHDIRWPNISLKINIMKTYN